MVAQTDAAVPEMLRLLGAPALHPLVGVLKAVEVVGVHQGKFKFLSTNIHALAPFSLAVCRICTSFFYCFTA